MYHPEYFQINHTYSGKLILISDNSKLFGENWTLHFQLNLLF
jgi:hypothetical protein